MKMDAINTINKHQMKHIYRNYNIIGIDVYCWKTLRYETTRTKTGSQAFPSEYATYVKCMNRPNEGGGGPNFGHLKFP